MPGDGFSTATDLADYLVKKGLPFRTSHEIVAEIVNYAVKSKVHLHEIQMSEFKKYSNKIVDDVYEVLTVLGSVTARDHIGATSPKQILQAIKKAEINLRKKLS